MEDRQNERFTDAELHAFFDRLFPNGFAGPDVLAELAPDGWERSPLLACFHPSVEQKYVERLQFHEGLESLRNARRSALDRQPPATVRAYRQVYGRDPRGWPPS